jgi:hypothetical protein
MPKDSYGALSSNIEGTKPTFTCLVNDLSPYASATDLMVLQNPAGSNRIIKLTRGDVNGDATAAALQDVYLAFRDTLDTGGTSTTPAIRKHDSNDPAPIGVVQLYTASPTLGSGGAYLKAGHYVFPAAATPAFPAPSITWQWGDHAAKCPTLYPGTQVSFNLGGTVAAGLSLYLSFEWTEEVLSFT